MFIQSYITIASSYLLIGVVIALLLELVIRKYTEFEIKPLERFFFNCSVAYYGTNLYL